MYRILACPLCVLTVAVGLLADEQLTSNRHKDWSPTISPDGKTLLFLSKQTTQDIWSLDLATRELSRVTNDATWERHVRFAPDGRQIAYLGRRGLDTFVMVKPFPTGAARDFGRGDDLAWSPDGKWLASRDDRGLFLIDGETGERAMLCDATRASPGSMQWRRKEGTLVYLHEGDVYEIDLASRLPHKLFSSKEEDARANFKTFALAPDGKHVIAVLDLSALALQNKDEGILLAPGKRLRLGPMANPIWRSRSTLIFSHEGNIYKLELGGAPRRIAGTGNFADEPMLSLTDGWLYFCARQPERRRAGGMIRAKYSEIYRVRLKD